ncbi:NEW3 domain-containing protein [Jiangella alba]|nr:NEW3 domain-containing protein [Jiangella alba]
MAIGMLAVQSIVVEGAANAAVREKPPFQPEIEIAIPDRIFTETPFELAVTIDAGDRALPRSSVEVALPDGWTTPDDTVSLRPLPRGRSTRVTFDVTPSATVDSSSTVDVTLESVRWAWHESADVAVEPCLVPEPVDPRLKVPESAFSRRLEWVGPVVYDPGYTLWGASPVVDDEGRFHLFIARWPERNVDPAWRRSSEIAHYFADSPEGPFEFSDVALQGTGQEGDWDRYAPHNPEIRRFGDKYVLLYIGNSDYRQPPHPNNQQIGMAVADSPYGPWEKINPDSEQPGLLISPQAGHFTEGKMVTNPTMMKLGDTYFVYFKTRVGAKLVFGAATSKNLTGPYQLLEDPLTPEGVTIEDATVFTSDGQVQFLTTDNHGDVTGIVGGGAMFFSEDGYTFDLDRTSLGYRRVPYYYEAYGDFPIRKIYGPDPKFEQPKVLTVDGKARYLYASSGWNVTGQDRTVIHLLRVADHPVARGDERGTGCNLLRNGDLEAGTRAGNPPAAADWGVPATELNLPGWEAGSEVVVAASSASGKAGYGTASTTIESPSKDTVVGFNSNESTAPPTTSSIRQTFVTTPGQTYRLSFDLGALSSPAKPMGLTAQLFDGAIDSGDPAAPMAEGRVTVETNGFGQRLRDVVTFTATSDRATLVLFESSATTNSGNVAVDNVSVRAVLQVDDTGPELAAPTGVTHHLADGKIVLSWASVSGADGYAVSRMRCDRPIMVAVAHGRTSVALGASEDAGGTYTVAAFVDGQIGPASQPYEVPTDPAHEVPTDPTPRQIVVDDSDLGDACPGEPVPYMETGSWFPSGLPGWDGGPSRYSGAIGSTATWTPTIAGPSDYLVEAWVPAHATTTTSATYTVRHADGESTVLVDQRSRGGWVPLGTWRFAAGTDGWVRLDVNNSSVHRLDAVRFTPTEGAGR